MSQWQQAIQPSDLSSSVNDVSHSYMLIPKVSAVSALSQLVAKCRVRVTCKSGQLIHHRAQQNNSEPVWLLFHSGTAVRCSRSSDRRSPPSSAAQNRHRQSRGYADSRGWRRHELDSSAAEIAAHAHRNTSIWTNASLAALLKSTRGKSTQDGIQLNQNSKAMETDRPRHDGLAACVIAKQYYSATFVSVCFH
jgi:hypothetical protein